MLYSRRVLFATQRSSSSGVFSRPVVRMFSEASAASEVNNEVLLTDRAKERIRALSKHSNKPDLKLRLEVDGGGCSGFSYKFSVFNGAAEQEDVVFGDKDAPLVVDTSSLEFLKGSKVDFTEDLIRRSFEVVNNPQVESQCGCGTSFSIKERK